MHSVYNTMAIRNPGSSTLIPLRRGEGDAIAMLRRAVANHETVVSGIGARHLPLGVPEMQAHLPGPGLACGVLHDMAAREHGDRPAAFGFLFALTAVALHWRPGPAVLVATRRALVDFGQPCGHGLAQLGLDVGRLLIVETRTDKDALW